MPYGGLLGILDGLTGTDVIVVLIVGLIVLGPEKLPEISRSLGEWIAKLRRIATNLQSEMHDVLSDPAMQPIKEIGEFVAQPRKKISEFALAAEVEATDAANAAAQADANAAAIAEANAIVEPAIEPDAEPSPGPSPEPDAETMAATAAELAAFQPAAAARAELVDDAARVEPAELVDDAEAGGDGEVGGDSEPSAAGVDHTS